MLRKVRTASPAGGEGPASANANANPNANRNASASASATANANANAGDLRDLRGAHCHPGSAPALTARDRPSLS